MNSKKDLMGKTNYFLVLLFFLIFIVCTTIYYVAAEVSGAPREMVDAVVEEGADEEAPRKPRRDNNRRGFKRNDR